MYSKYLRIFVFTLLSVSLLVTPFTTFAKSEGKDKKVKGDVKIEIRHKSDDRDEKENKENSDDKKIINIRQRQCFSVWKRIFTRGWSVGNVEDFGTDCWLPFGIAKKFRGIATTTPSTPDTTAPILSSISAVPYQNRVVIKWETNEKADGKVFYSTSSSVDENASTTSSVNASSLVKSHRFEINNLSATTTYYFKVRSKDASANSTTSEIKTFITLAAPLDTSNPVISHIVAITGTSTVSVFWNTNELSTSKVYYGTTTIDTNASTTLSVENNSLVTSHFLSLTGLATSTAYQIVVESKDSSGNKTLAPQFAATTASGL